jgi:arylsulfatase B
VKVVTAGRYEISVRRWPVEANHPITAALPPGEKVPGADAPFRARPGVAIPATTATLRIGGRDLASSPVRANDTAVTFTTTLAAGSHQLAPVFTTADGHEVGAYYAVVTKLP